MLKKTILVILFVLGLTTLSGSYDRIDATTRENALLAERFEPNDNLMLLSEGEYEISAYDNIFRNICESEGIDWRLMSAIAYHESRFMPDLCSPKGARGMMQIMPHVARQFDVTVEALNDPVTNIRVANRVVKMLTKMMRIPTEVSPEDRLSLILAAYNSGIGHVADARRLAKAHGENPNSWESVSRYLELKADPAYYEHEVVKYGRFSGSRETIAYVKGVRDRYARYCNRVAR
ncbi:MAG: transglycosylase SLT domain-containing protein [Alistipes sp.]|nr:transglycosylase SLT domain-containing protein [Alistipes sp.]